eukprot:TRINITY_DN9706_c0_g1_i1.p1 TRINITY_DN9706_c0_g1~~TRINITY_DN9706_c0_g1_i1.p1  ORF type:complete len:475 (+),score=78.86 TRINITY_DN9706_c0_g1_i1:172-1596(+)
MCIRDRYMGDIALIKSVEDFEDRSQFASQQMIDLHFSDQDLLISSSGVGAAPWVIGSLNYAVQAAQRSPWFLYGNPDDQLISMVERSKKILLNNKIKKLNLTVGSMAITGSTRMQSATILMYAIGIALFEYHKFKFLGKEKPKDYNFKSETTKQLDNFIQFLENLKEDDILEDFIKKESSIQIENDFIFYSTDYNFSLSILTDTTERSPSFSLFPFENQRDSPIKPSFCYLVIEPTNESDLQLEEMKQSEKAWFDLLGFRKFRGLEGDYWSKYKNIVSEERAYGYDFTRNVIKKRISYCNQGKSQHYMFKIKRINDKQKEKVYLDFNLSLLEETRSPNNHNPNIPISKIIDITPISNSRLEQHVLLKILLNTHSTLSMGLQGKYLSNIMVWVRPSNNKLIDRAIRFVQFLLNDYKNKFVKKEQENLFQALDYEQICYFLFAEIETLQYGESVVLKTLKSIIAEIFGVSPENIII